MSARGRAARRDASEKPIVDALRAVGKKVSRVSGEGLPDLLIGPEPPCKHCGRNARGFEVKTKAGRRTAAQEDSQWPVIRDVTEALTAIGVQN